MFQKGSFTIPSDSSGILLVKVIQTRRCSTRKHADIGKFLKVVLRNTKTKLSRRRKRKVRAIVIRSQRYYAKKFGMYYQFGTNSLVLLKKRMNTMGKELYGPTSKMLKIRKFRIAFKHIFKVTFFLSYFKNYLNKPFEKFCINIFFFKHALAITIKHLNFPYFFKNTKILKIVILKNNILNFFWKYFINFMAIFIFSAFII